ncbi:STAS domain-containing protein [Lutibacter sp. B2]|nr:STAS domain-containing protein [Lutibacter sp. B2]
MKDISILIPENFAVDEVEDLREKINHLISEGEKDFVLDFSSCKFIDSTGLGVLIAVYKKCTGFNGSLKLHSMNPQVMKVFKLTRLDKIFDIQK